MFIQLLYTSTATQPLGEQDVNQILDSARHRNLNEGVTGMLCHGNSRFLQCLEGEQNAVDGIYNRILKDTRHDHIKLIYNTTLDRRFFGDWSMGFVDIDDLWTKVALRQILQTDQFLPEEMGPETALRLIKSLKTELTNQIIVD